MEKKNNFSETEGLMQASTNLFLDLQREKASGLPEIIFAPGKSNEDIILAIKTFIHECSSVFVSKLSLEQCELLKSLDLSLEVCSLSRVAWYGKAPLQIAGKVAILSGGSADRAIVDEARYLLNYLGAETELFCDVGVASINRLISRISEIRKADVVIVCAGMEGALPAVVAGLTSQPIIGLPTSIGYGASMNGLTALNSMLSACSPGISVVNIDNGIGAASSAARMLRLLLS